MKQTNPSFPPVVFSPATSSRGQAEQMLPIRAKQRRDGNLLVNLSTGTRLTLSFILAALIAALVVGAIGIQRSQSLTNQSQFYQNLLRVNTNLTTGAQYLQLIRTETQSILTQLTSTQTSQETLNTEEQALDNLSKRYNDTLTQYVENDQLTKHPSETALLLEANHGAQINQQGTLSSSALRTWRVYQASITQVLALIKNGQTAEALHLEQFQVEPTNADSLSALRALIQFDSKLAASIQDAANIEQQTQYITTIISSIIAFLAIMLIGWIISGTIVRRLNRLREVTKEVERGELNRRVKVIGSDEIADVTASFNAMLEAIVGLLEETRHQRDALTNAAEHLFTDMRVVSAGDLRVNAAVSNDPIGMLANAFNFTVGRFRRFVQRTRTIAEQLDVISHQEIERAEKFTQTALIIKTGPLDNPGSPISPSQLNPRSLTSSGAAHQLQRYTGNLAGSYGTFGIQSTQHEQTGDIVAQLQDIHEDLQQRAQNGIIENNRSLTDMSQQLTGIVERLNRLAMGITTPSIRQEEMRKRILEEIRLLDIQLKTVTIESQNTQKDLFKSFQELDQKVSEVALVLRTQNTKELSGTDHSRVELERRESSYELMQLSAALASDIIGMARQLSSLAQEIRTSIISFQLDTVEGSNSLSNIPLMPTPEYGPTLNAQRHGSTPISGERW